MKRKLVMAVGLACGALCALCVGLYVDSVRGQVDQARAEALDRYGGDQLEVVVAKRDIAAGEAIDDSAVEMKLWVADLLPEGSLVSLDQVKGRSASSPILMGEVLNEKRFTDLDDRLEVPDGLVAVSVPAKDVQAVGGAITSGLKVDVYATGGTSTDLLAQDVLVLSTNADAAADYSEEDMSWITVAIQPDLVQGLVAAAQKTELYFALPGEGLISANESGAGEKDDADDSTDGDRDSSSDIAKAAAEQAEIEALLKQDVRKE